jgi:translation initiation factor 2 alpha subunit (eIF-2alpha)
MANQRKKGVKQLTHFDWEHNVEKLRAIAKRRGIALSELLRELTKEVVEKYGEDYKDYNEDK